MNVKAIKPILFAFTAISLVACGSKTSDKSATETTTPPPTRSETDPNYIDVVALAGDATALDTNNSGHGFSTPMSNLSDSELDIHLTGDANFETSFTTAPNDAHPELDGLGPVFNNNNCNACHQRDGRPSTIVPTAEQQTVKLANDAGIFLRVSLADGVCEMPSSVNDFCQVTGVEGFGDQLFHRGILQAREDWQTHNFGGQADVYLSYDYTEFSYPDGSTVTLKKPVFTIDNAWDSPENFSLSALANENVRFSARNGMPVFGLGLLEAIEEQDILALEDVDDADNDGISGKANWVFDAVKAQAGDENPVSLGRFGWKASTPSVRQQSLGALRGDMGVTNSLFPEESIANTLMHESYLSRTNYQDTGSDEQGLPEASEFGILWNLRQYFEFYSSSGAPCHSLQHTDTQRDRHTHREKRQTDRRERVCVREKRERERQRELTNTHRGPALVPSHIVRHNGVCRDQQGDAVDQDHGGSLDDES